MTSIHADPESKRPEIVNCANQCLGTFERCLSRASSIHPREFSMVENQVARFRTWSAGIGIFAPGQASADHQLRCAPDVHTVIVGLLDSLNYRIETCRSHALEMFALVHSLVNLHNDCRVLTQPSTGYDVLDVIGEFTTVLRLESLDKDLIQALHDISTELSHLERMSTAVRRASDKARNIEGRGFQIKNDVEGLLSSQFSHHILDRFPNISETLRKRLICTMLLRHKSLLYRRVRQERMAVHPREAVSEPLFKPSIAELKEAAARTVLQGVEHQETSEEHRWRNHVVNDLEPYVCLIEGCAQPDELYAYSDTWIDHLRQHGQYWRCSSHREIGLFSTREDYIQHLQNDHGNRISDTKLRTLANRNTVGIFQSCPLCGSDKSGVGRRLLEHIAEHLMSLALISLPSSQHEVSEEAESGNTSVRSSRPLNRDAIGDLEFDKAPYPTDAGRLEIKTMQGSFSAEEAKAKNSMEGKENDPILQAVQKRQEGVRVTFSGAPASNLTLEQFLQKIPEFHWPEPDGTKGPVVGMDYELMPVQFGNRLDDLLGYSDRSYTQLIQLVTADGEQDHVAMKIMKSPPNIYRLKNEVNKLRSLRHKHISAILGTCSRLTRRNKLEYGILEFPLAAQNLQDFLEGISEHNRFYQQQDITLSLHPETHKILPYFACLCKTVLFLQNQDRPIKHGDIKPANILIDRVDNIVLAEFDISKAYDLDKEATTYGSLDATIMYSAKDISKESSIQGLEWDIISLGFVFLEMATVLFGKTLDEMRKPMGRRSTDGHVRVVYSEASTEIRQWLNVLRETATHCPDMVPAQFFYISRTKQDYLNDFLRAIEDMISAKNGRTLKLAWMTFGVLSEHCPSPQSDSEVDNVLRLEAL